MRCASPLRLFVFFVLVVVGLLVGIEQAHAQMSETDRKAAARAAYMEGVALQDAGKPGEALVKFEAAQKVFDAPTHLLRIAECQAQIGKLVEAQETYETLIRKPLGSNPPEAFVAAQKAAEQELPAVRARIPTLRISVKPDASQLPNLQVVVNNGQMPNELLGIARPVNPGTYKLTAQATGWATAGPTEVELRDKDQRAVELTLVRSNAVVVAPVPVAPAPAPYPTPATQQPAPTPAPPPVEAPKPPPGSRSSDTGLLMGVHTGVFIPGGTVVPATTSLTGESTGTRDFKDVARTGGGVGLDLAFRLGRTLLLGGIFDYASLGSPDRAPSDYSAGTLYYAALLGLLANPDKVSFYGDVSLGGRSLSASGSTPAGKAELSASGVELGISMGVMIPAGPIRILPKIGVNYGTFSSSKTCISNVCSSDDIKNGAGHTMVFAGLAVYYHLDLGTKK